MKIISSEVYFWKNFSVQTDKWESTQETTEQYCYYTITAKIFWMFSPRQPKLYKSNSYILSISYELSKNQCNQKNKYKIPCSFMKILVCDTWESDNAVQ
jgi:hypothetical protein